MGKKKEKSEKFLKNASKVNLNKTIPIVAILIISLLIFFYFLTQSLQLNSQTKKYDNSEDFPVINPMEMTQSKSQVVNLYFRYEDSSFLTKQSREISTQPNERFEEALLRELIKGPQDSGNSLHALIPDSARVIKVEEKGEVLYITFDSELLSQERLEAQQDETRLRLMTKSIVNSLLDLGTYTRVQILVDRKGNGTGEKLAGRYFGILEKGAEEDVPLQALTYDDSVVLTAEKVLSTIVYAINNKEWDSLYQMVSPRDGNGLAKPSFDSAIEEWTNTGCGINDYYLVSMVETTRGNMILRISLTGQSKGFAYSREDFPVLMIQNDYVWHIPYDTLLRMMSREEI